MDETGTDSSQVCEPLKMDPLHTVAIVVLGYPSRILYSGWDCMSYAVHNGSSKIFCDFYVTCRSETTSQFGQYIALYAFPSLILIFMSSAQTPHPLPLDQHLSKLTRRVMSQVPLTQALRIVPYPANRQFWNVMES